MKIFVGSTNPVKVNAVTIAASEQWPEVVVAGVSAPSEVGEQPWGDPETRLGSENRAKNALEMGLKQLQEAGDSYSGEVLGIGLEGGVMKIDGELWSTVWVSLIDTRGITTASNGARFKVPDIIANPILAGEEMGPVVSKLFKGANIKQEKGAIGVITQDFVDRTEEYTGIAKMTIGLWFGKGWEEKIS